MVKLISVFFISLLPGLSLVGLLLYQCTRPSIGRSINQPGSTWRGACSVTAASEVLGFGCGYRRRGGGGGGGIWFGSSWFDKLRFCFVLLVWCGMIWVGLVWFDLVPIGLVSVSLRGVHSSFNVTFTV